MRFLRNLLLAVLAASLAFVGLLAVEAVVAFNGSMLPDRPALELDRTIGAELGVEPMDLLWLGDSTGAGVGASGIETALPTLVARELSDEVASPVRLHVLAESGARVRDVLLEQLPRIDRDGIEVVVVGVGGNDVTHLTGGAFFEETYDAVLDVVERFRPAAVVSVGVGDFGATPRIPQPLRAITGWRARRIDAKIREVARRHDIGYADIYALAGPLYRARPEVYHAADGFHPSDEGYRVWADAIGEVLRAELEGGGSL